MHNNLPAPHTPGPWTQAHSTVNASNSRRNIVQWQKPIQEMSEEYQANATLIALAPELLEALVNLLDEYTAAHFVGRMGNDSLLFQERAEAKAVLEKYYGSLSTTSRGELIQVAKLAKE